METADQAADSSRRAMTEGGGEASGFRGALKHALATGPSRSVRRLGRCEGRIAFVDSAGDAVLLQADREHVGVVDGDEAEASTTLRFEPTALDRFATGRVCLCTAIIGGAVAAEGELARMLPVSPILAGLLGERDPDEDRWLPMADADRMSATAVPDDVWAIRAREVHKSFGPASVLQGVDLDIPEGAITVILGPSGTGKSVMLKHIIGLLRPDAGEVVVHGRSLNKLSPTEMLALRRRFGVLFQDGALFGSMSLFDNVAFPLRQHTDLPEPDIARMVARRLSEVGLATFENAAPGTLSGGQRKRAGLARALVMDPEIVLFDEPDSGLDPVRTSLLSDLMLQTHPLYGGTYVVITHDIMVARKVADYIALLWRGKVVESGPRERVLGSENPFVRQFLSGEPDGPLAMD